MQILSDTLTRLQLGADTTYQNLTLFPLLSDVGGEPDYLTLDEALGQNLARITEVSQGGSVPELKFVNESDYRILLLDGEELVGAKQNRVLNLTILVSAHATLNIPVSCVEAGRWSHTSQEFAAAPRAHYAAGRARKMAQVSETMTLSGGRHSDQGEVWRDIAEKSARMESHSPTSAMAEMYEQNESQLNGYVNAFTATEGQVGALFAIKGEIVGFDLFDYPVTLRKLLPKLVRSYALDAIDSQALSSNTLLRSGAGELLQAVGQAEARLFPALGAGEDVRLSGAELIGGALVVEGRVVHLSVFRMKQDAQSAAYPVHASMSRPSLRRQNRQSL